MMEIENVLQQYCTTKERAEYMNWLNSLDIKELAMVQQLCDYCWKFGIHKGDTAEAVYPHSAMLDEKTKKWLEGQTARERLQVISDMCVDWDGHRTADRLGELINEVRAYCEEDTIVE